MLGLNYKNKFIYVAIFLAGFGLSSFASANAELSGHFGMKFGSDLNLQEITGDDNNYFDQKNRPWHFGVDALYRQGGESSSLGLGVRYRFAFTGEKDFEETGATTDKYKFTHHRLALLLNYRFNMDQFFVGVVAGVDVWKSLKFTGINIATRDSEQYFNSSQFLWEQITGQLGLELGYKVTPNFLVKLEGGYDLSSFGDLECKFKGNQEGAQESDCSPNPLLTGVEEEATEKLKLSGFYATLGIGWFFG